MKSMLARSWWIFALRGVFAIIFGLMALAWPQLTLLALVLLFGIYALVDGVLAVAAGLTAKGHAERWWGPVLQGVASIVLGFLTLLYPRTTAMVLLYFIAAWAFIAGVLIIAAAIQLRKTIHNEWFMVLCGVLTLIFGALLVLFPGAGALSLVWMIGAYAISVGVLLLILGLRLRNLPSTAELDKAAPA